VGLTDSTGALVGNETYQYDPYGQLIVQPHTAALRTNAWRYASGYYDVSTGLYKFGIRYYDAATGRWTQRDPVGGSLAETTKVNPYVYADDDPVNMTDPSGRNSALQTFEDCMGVSLNFAIFALGTLATLLGAGGLAFAAIVDLTAPVWIQWVILIGAAVAVGVILGCALAAVVYGF
jgi:RHS repeat-associated protein